jgi:hypothetical protein
VIALSICDIEKDDRSTLICYKNDFDDLHFSSSNFYVLRYTCVKLRTLVRDIRADVLIAGNFDQGHRSRSRSPDAKSDLVDFHIVSSVLSY